MSAGFRPRGLVTVHAPEGVTSHLVHRQPRAGKAAGQYMRILAVSCP
jgi:hypothetical protein